MKKVSLVDEDDLERLVPIAEGARMLGLSPDAIRKRQAGTETLTLVIQSSPQAERPRYFLVLGEILEHRRKLIEEGRRRRDWAENFFRERSTRK